jgi:hypothetical protein
VTRDLVTFGFSGDVARVATLGFALLTAAPSGGNRDIITLGFSGNVTRVATLGFGGGMPAAPLLAGGDVITLGFSGDVTRVPTLGFGPWATAPTYTTLHEFVEARLSLLGLPVHISAIPQTHRLEIGPVITYEVPDWPTGHHLMGADGTSQAEVDVSVWSLLVSAADGWGQAIRDILDGYVGDIATVCLLQDEADQLHPPQAGTDQWVFEIRYRYLINHRVR